HPARPQVSTKAGRPAVGPVEGSGDPATTGDCVKMDCIARAHTLPRHPRRVSARPPHPRPLAPEYGGERRKHSVTAAGYSGMRGGDGRTRPADRPGAPGQPRRSSYLSSMTPTPHILAGFSSVFWNPADRYRCPAAVRALTVQRKTLV